MSQLFGIAEFLENIRQSFVDERIVAIRYNLADFTAKEFLQVATEIVNQSSSKEHEQVDRAVALLLKISSSLISGASDLFKSGNDYAAAALLRQLVEVEYLAWAFDDHESEAKKWIVCSKEERRKFFTPAKLRKASQGRFRSKDYSYHCELGGHPAPESYVLLENSDPVGQLLLSDMLGHSGRIWDHLINWAIKGNKNEAILSRKKRMLKKYAYWKDSDPATILPPPP